MSTSKLPPNASLEYLKKLAKNRLAELRRSDPRAKLATVQLAIAREYGFSSWRALKAEIDRLRAPRIDTFFSACLAGDGSTVRRMLDEDPGLANQRDPSGSTCLHQALRRPHIVQLLLERGADPNARDTGDNALPLHFAAGIGNIKSVRLLLDAGSDVHGYGDLHEGEVIGWAACGLETHRDIVALLVERGARHHIFSAIAMGDTDLVRQVVRENPRALDRRLSRFEGHQTPIHYALFAPDGLAPRPAIPQYDMLDVLVAVGADPDAVDGKGRSPLMLAMLRGDAETMRRLRDAGANEPALDDIDVLPGALPALGSSIQGITPVLSVSDAARSIAWYSAIGFTLTGKHEENGVIDWWEMKFGRAIIMFVPGRSAAADKPISLWLYTDRIDELHAVLKTRQLRRARAILAGKTPAEPEVSFRQDLYTAFYGQREFCIRDPDGYDLNFAQPL